MCDADFVVDVQSIMYVLFFFLIQSFHQSKGFSVKIQRWSIIFFFVISISKRKLKFSSVIVLLRNKEHYSHYLRNRLINRKSLSMKFFLQCWISKQSLTFVLWLLQKKTNLSGQRIWNEYTMMIMEISRIIFTSSSSSSLQTQS